MINDLSEPYLALRTCFYIGPHSSVSFIDCTFFKDFLGGNAAELVPEEVEESLKTLLVPNEKVRIAYKCGRDMAAFTTKRIILVDRKGIF